MARKDGAGSRRAKPAAVRKPTNREAVLAVLVEAGLGEEFILRDVPRDDGILIRLKPGVAEAVLEASGTDRAAMLWPVVDHPRWVVARRDRLDSVRVWSVGVERRSDLPDAILAALGWISVGRVLADLPYHGRTLPREDPDQAARWRVAVGFLAATCSLPGEAAKVAAA